MESILHPFQLLSFKAILKVLNTDKISFLIHFYSNNFYLSFMSTRRNDIYSPNFAISYKILLLIYCLLENLSNCTNIQKLHLVFSSVLQYVFWGRYRQKQTRCVILCMLCEVITPYQEGKCFRIKKSPILSFSQFCEAKLAHLSISREFRARLTTISVCRKKLQ